MGKIILKSVSDLRNEELNSVTYSGSTNMSTISIANCYGKERNIEHFRRWHAIELCNITESALAESSAKLKLLVDLRIILILIVCLTIFLFSCNKEESNVIYGVVTSLISGETIENVEVNLEVNEVTSGSVNTTYKLIGSTTTDAKGSYSFEFESIMALTYRLTFIKPGFAPKTVSVNPTDVVDKINVSPQIFRSSFLRLRVRNTSPNNEQDQLILRITGLAENHCNVCCHSNLRYFDGTSIDEIIACPVIGGDTITLSVMVNKHQQTYNEIKLYCTPNDTVNFNLYY